MTTALLVLLIVVVVCAVLLVSARMTGQIAKSYGADPAYWQARTLPFGFFGPIVTWIMLNRRDGGGFA
ncbi:MAG TPA: hypothetical protein VG708_09325 [Mycobacteriales bacterium]|nr:hypothetical protein [Mycobacteriales bacterium]